MKLKKQGKSYQVETMNLNKEDLDFILNLPTKRLLRLFKTRREEMCGFIRSTGYLGDTGWSSEEMDSISLDKKYEVYSYDWNLQHIKKYKTFLNVLQKELNTREHIENEQ